MCVAFSATQASRTMIQLHQSGQICLQELTKSYYKNNYITMTQIQRLIIRCFETFLLPLTRRNKSTQMSHFPLKIYHERYEIKKKGEVNLSSAY